LHFSHRQSCKFQREEITGVQNFNDAANFSQNVKVSAPSFVFMEKNTQWRKFTGNGTNAPLCCHEAVRDSNTVSE